ncbi:hypothetical protein OIO90_000922 [Microbotryomycetes sp. JL221]|nr:hypothetical protein OIO90_000922 [Microbotryomycetes sp. JL221]
MSSPISLVLPPPPPPAVLSRGSPGSDATPTFTTLEPSIDDLTQELSQLKSDLSDIVSAITDIHLLREQVSSSEHDVTHKVQPVRQLASLTTLTGDRIIRLSTPLADLSAKIETLSELAQEGRAAATSLEVGIVKEEAEAVKLGIREAMQSVIEAAEDEKFSLEESKDRFQAIIKAENPTLGPDAVRVTLNDAVRGLDSKVSELDPSSYAARFAIEHPFTELAKLLKVATEVHRSASQATHRLSATNTTGLQRMATHSSVGTTLVGTDFYSKDDDPDDGPGDIESQPLRGDHAMPPSMIHVDNGLYVPTTSVAFGLIKGKNAVKYHKFMAYMKIHWRDVLIRSSLAVILLGVVIGLITWQALERRDQQDELEREAKPSDFAAMFPVPSQARS